MVEGYIGQGQMKEVGWMGANEDWRCIRKRDRAVTSEEGGGKSMWPQTQAFCSRFDLPASDISPNLSHIIEWKWLGFETRLEDEGVIFCCWYITIFIIMCT